MKHRLFLTIAAAAVLGCAGNAAAQTAAPSGHVGVDYGRTNLEAFGGEANANAWQLDGSFAFPTTGATNLAIDAAIENFDSDDLDGGATLVTGTGHLGYRMGDTNLVGLFAGAEHNEEATLWAVGLEGQNTSSMGGIDVQVGYGRADELDGVDFWAERIEGRLYPMDNVRLALNLGGTQLKTDIGDTSLWNIGGTAEYQFSAMPISIWGGYERGEWSDVDLTSDTWRVGVRYNFGGSLHDRDAAGASLGGVSNLFGGTMGAGVVAALGEFMSDIQ